MALMFEGMDYAANIISLNVANGNDNIPASVISYLQKCSPHYLSVIEMLVEEKLKTYGIDESIAFCGYSGDSSDIHTGIEAVN